MKMKFDTTDTDRRMNLRLSAANDDALRVLARLHDSTKTQIANAAIYEYAESHAREIRDARELFDRLS